MTPQEIRDAIAADPQLQALLPDTVALAAHPTFAARTELGLVTRSDFAGWAATTGMRAKIQDFSVSAGHPLRDSSLAILDVLSGGAAAGIDMSRPANQAIVGAWVALGELSQTNSDALTLLAQHSAPVTEFEIRCAVFNDDGSLAV